MLQKIGNHTYVETEYESANVSCIVSEKGLILIDTPYLPEDLADWQAHLSRISNKDVLYVINTDHHFDHVLGNHVLGGLVVANEIAYERMITPGGTLRERSLPILSKILGPVTDEIAMIPIVPPHITFTDRLTLRLSDLTFELITVGGHSDATSVVYLIEDKILFSGDCVETDRHPIKFEAKFGDWIEALKTIQQMDIDIIVPGHGDITDKAEASRMLVYFYRQWDTVSRCIRQGKSKEETIEECHHILGFYPLEPGVSEKMASRMFDDGIARLYDEIVSLRGVHVPTNGY